MKIYLFLSNRIKCFLLPKESLGSFGFDEYEDEESKLINVEAIDDIWYIYSTSDVKVLNNGIEQEKMQLETGKFYVLRRKNVNYLIYVGDIIDNIVNIYKYSSDFDITIGNNSSSNIIINHEFVNNLCAKISFSNGSLLLEKKVNFVYLNENQLLSNSQKLDCGDQINIYYLKIIIMKNLIVVISDSKVNLSNIKNSGLTEYSVELDDCKDFEIVDEDLYSQNDYYFKSPRIRRFIENKEVKFSKPPVGPTEEEMPALLTIGPIITMGIMSFVTLSQTLSSLISKEKSLSTEWPRLLTAGAMLISMLLWPLLIRFYSKRQKERSRKKLEKKYGRYLDERREELSIEAKYQSDVLRENLLSTHECLDIIAKHGYNFWDRRNDQDDFLQVRLGIGTEKLNVDVKYSEEDFTVDEDDLKKQADKVVEEFKNLYNVPVKYSFYENKITAVIGEYNKCHAFVNNLLLQLITFYTYEDLKFVVFTNNNNMYNWDYLKYTNHNFSNNKNIRYFSSSINDAQNVSEYLNYVASQRIQSGRSEKALQPHYIVIIDAYNMVKGLDFIKQITEAEENIGFSIVLIEDRLSDLPSKCDNFISIGQAGKCEVIRSSAEIQEHIEFKEEIIYNLNMMEIARNVANIPIEFEEKTAELPDSVSFLEMEKVGKVEQLNILNRWNINDSTISLRSEVGIDENGNLVYLDLHEKAHGPHGLIAGTTGSGKSEFIITYVLSLCINFSPDIVSFALIDYKGGGLALAFENKTTGVVLPHLAGTITNLDKAEMDRTLVSIDSEVKRRQQIFNQAREQLGESTIDIYKYQRFYKEGRLQEPIPHLFIICDEFAELKSQQPEFMDNLISVARIGRSLGVHLILATQKPSGVVNDQIWSNSRFKVCLKVQDETDSKEMLKKPDAAYLKQAGRFYLQVGYDEYYVLGQSGWCGAKYYPSDKIVKEVDKSINFIDNSGNFIKNIKASSNKKSEAVGDQFSSILNSIISISKKTGKKSRKLWLDNIPPIILVDDLIKKYNIEINPYNVEAIIGEYDAPETQQQGIVKYNYLDQGNTIIYGNDGTENEMLLDSIIYSTCKYHRAEEVNFYIMDYGSEVLRKYEQLPHVGGIVFASDEEKYNNLIKLLKNEIKRRKQIFTQFGGEYRNYVKSNKLPLIVVILNNYDSISDSNKDLFEVLPDLIRDSERYGILFVITCNSTGSIRSRITTNCNNVYALKLNDKNEYSIVFGMRASNVPRNILGRGFMKKDVIHEFQVSSIISDIEQYSDYINEFVRQQIELNSYRAKQIPTLPRNVRYEDIKSEVNSINNVPVGISKENLEIMTVDYLNDLGNIITSNRLNNTLQFIRSLISTLIYVNNLQFFVIDPLNKLGIDKKNFTNYFTDDLSNITKKIQEYINVLIEKGQSINGVILIYGFDKYMSKLDDKKLFENLLNSIKKYEKFSIIIVDDCLKIKNYIFEAWFKTIFNLNNGIWVGKGLFDQSLFHLTSVHRDMSKDIQNNMGYVIVESSATLSKLLDFYSIEEEK